jgi:4-hydroxy-3-methylbut-2-en-1-yl diphosphate reductase
VIGSANSSNTVALAKVARTAGCPIVLRIDGPQELDLAALGDAKVVGVTAGASAPEDLVQEVIEHLAPVEGVELINVTDEDEYFPPPRELRELLPRLALLLSQALGGPTGEALPRSLPDDRSLDASTVLADLAPR